jgi:hypothetical protein
MGERMLLYCVISEDKTACLLRRVFKENSSREISSSNAKSSARLSRKISSARILSEGFGSLLDLRRGPSVERAVSKSICRDDIAGWVPQNLLGTAGSEFNNTHGMEKRKRQAVCENSKNLRGRERYQVAVPYVWQQPPLPNAIPCQEFSILPLHQIPCHTPDPAMRSLYLAALFLPFVLGSDFTVGVGKDETTG